LASVRRRTPCRGRRHWWIQLADLTQVDQVISDLDRGAKAAFADVLGTALRLCEALQRLGLESYPRTNGGQGLYVYMHLAAGHTFDALRG
jgi:DNA primase